MDKGAVTFGSSVNSRIFLIGSKSRNDRGFSWFWEEVVQAWSWFSNIEKIFFGDFLSRTGTVTHSSDTHAANCSTVTSSPTWCPAHINTNQSYTVCPSVCLSQAGLGSPRQNLGSCKQRSMIAQRLAFTCQTSCKTWPTAVNNRRQPSTVDHTRRPC